MPDYTQAISQFVVDSPTSYHAAQAVAARLEKRGFKAVDETVAWDSSIPARGYVIRDGAIAAWCLPSAPSERTGFRIVGAHTDSPALKLKPQGAIVREGWEMINAEIYGGTLENSWLDREVGLAGRLTTYDGAVHLVRTGPIARTAQVAPHLDRSAHENLHLDRQAHMLPLTALAGEAVSCHDIENYLCEQAGISPDQLAFHDVFTYLVQPPSVFGLHQEFLASSRLDNLSSVHAGLVALENLAGTETDAAVFVAFDHEEVGSGTRSGAGGPFLQDVLHGLAAVMGFVGDGERALLARSSCISADAGHSVHPNYGQLHDPQVRPLINHGPLLKINARQRYATDAVGGAIWKRACRAAGVPTQDFVSNNSVPCGTTIGPITASRLGITTVDVGIALLSMHSAREMCGVEDGPYLARALHAYWAEN